MNEAVRVASIDGLGGLSIGRLAKRLELSKSGLFAHFGSKEALQAAVLQRSIERFIGEVIAPSLEQPRGVARIRDMFERWIVWEDELPGGCPLISAAVELDDRPGPLREFLAGTQRRWLDFVSSAAARAIAAGEFRADADTEQFAFEFNAIGLGYHYNLRLLNAPDSVERALRALDALIDRYRKVST